MIDRILRVFDSERNELVLRWRLWKSEWFPYRTAQFLGLNEAKDDMILGPWKWHRPRRFRKSA